LQPRRYGVGRFLVAVQVIPQKASSLRTVPESSRLVTTRAGGFFNRRYGTFGTGADTLIFLF
jgi:hypothetical protein